MKIAEVPFCVVDWASVSPTKHAGKTGEAFWRTFEKGNIRVRMVTELDDGRKFVLKAGSSYQVAEDINPHRSFTQTGAKLFIVD